MQMLNDGLTGSFTAGAVLSSWSVPEQLDESGLTMKSAKVGNLGKGLVGTRIHKLLNSSGQSSAAGNNPFAGFDVSAKPLWTIVTLYDPRLQPS